MTDAENLIAKPARGAMRALETLHIVNYFAPECYGAYAELGMKGMGGYFATRSAPMGPVPGEVTVATFYNFAPSVVMRAVPECWSRADPQGWLDVRHSSTLGALRRCVGDIDPDQLDEAVALTRTACEPLTTAGRPLFAGHAALPWPDEPLLALWHGASLLREHRGDGHLMMLVSHGLDPLEALVTAYSGTAMKPFAQGTRGWTDEQWSACEQRLRERGLLDEAGALTDAGTALRAAVEVDTDRLGAVGWSHLGEERAGRLRELVLPWAKAVAASGVLGPVAAK